MRIYENCYELISELFREVFEMGHICTPKSMQNKNIEGNDDYITKEIINYTYCLQSREQGKFLFLTDPRSRDWVKAEFQERLSNTLEGDAWRIRPELWEPLQNEKGLQDYTYGNRMNSDNSLQKVVRELKRNPDSRQCILSIWDRTVDIDGLGGKRRVPCSIYYQFILRGNQLHIIYNQRSADVITHLGNDVWLAWQLMKTVAKYLEVPEGFLYHNIASLHSYKKDWPQLKQCIDDIKNKS